LLVEEDVGADVAVEAAAVDVVAGAEADAFGDWGNCEAPEKGAVGGRSPSWPASKL